MDVDTGKSFHNFISKKNITITLVIVVCIVLTVVLDLFESTFQNYSFYLSESLLFSTFWILFLPLLYCQYRFRAAFKIKYQDLLFVLSFSVIHLFMYPLLVWLLSQLFFSNTFPFIDTLSYGLIQYSLIVLLSYAISQVAFRTFANEKQKVQSDPVETRLPEIAESFLITDGDRHLTIKSKEIKFLSANNPYVNLHHLEKRYLHNETLKSIEAKLDKRIFVRIHKSTLVNLNFVQHYKSRLNGDYDITMRDGTILRLSRNFAPAFKLKLQESHQDTAN